MGLSGGPPRDVIVKVYGQENLLFAVANPLFTMFMTASGRPAPSSSLERAEAAAARDARRMAERGYRIVDSEAREFPVLGAVYLRVTYRRDDGRQP